MDAKLTLKLDKRTIEMAKSYAEKHNISLSRMIESHLNSITGSYSEEVEITPLVKSLSGIIKLKRNYNYKSGYADYLKKKYK